MTTTLTTKGTFESYFTNELGNRIRVKVQKICDEDKEKERVCIEIEGPHSISSNTITVKEARTIMKGLELILAQNKTK